MNEEDLKTLTEELDASVRELKKVMLQEDEKASVEEENADSILDELDNA